MEDASKEFQVFMAHKRDHKPSYKEPSKSKQRIVPVISKMMSSSPSLFQNFTINQKKTNIYKAVSGVSFQNTHQGTHTSRSDNDQQRRLSLAPASTKIQNEEIEPISGARRSRSLTSMESEYGTYFDSKKREITHPCTPMLLPSRRQNLYASGRKKRRSVSQIRNDSETNKSEKNHNPEQPTRPRRSRSASRSRKSGSLTVFQNKSIQTPESSTRSEGRFRKQKEADKNTRKNSAPVNLEMNLHKINSKNDTYGCNDVGKDIDFTVNENDWQKYDVLVSKQLSKILKRKEESEGGYFSLEREEGEELEKSSNNEEYFQKENSNESIYVAQSFASNDSTNSQNTVTIEDIYREVLYDSPSQEVGYVDDEGLYEEIFFENKEPSVSVPVVKPIQTNNYSVTSPINILITPENQKGPPSTPLRTKRNHKNSLSTIVHIGGNDDFDSFINTKSPSINRVSIGTENLSMLQEIKNNVNSPRLNSGHNSAWIHSNPTISASGCHSQSNLSSSSSSQTCFASPHKNELSNPEAKNILESGYQDIKYGLSNQQNVKEKAAFFQRLSSSLNSSSSNQQNQELRKSSRPTEEVKESQNWTTTPINIQILSTNSMLEENRKIKSHPNLCESFDDGHWSRDNRDLSKSENVISKLPNRNISATSPPTFQGFLQNSLFNPDTESLPDAVDELVLQDDQSITCITDSSSSEDECSDDEANSTTSAQWLEAHNEFEFVTYNKQLENQLKENKTRKYIPKLSYTSKFESHNQKGSHHCEPEIPERPSRRRKRTSIITRS